MPHEPQLRQIDPDRPIEEQLPVNEVTGKRVEVIDLTAYFVALVDLGEQIVRANGYPLDIGHVTQGVLDICFAVRPDSPLYPAFTALLSKELSKRGYGESLEEQEMMFKSLAIDTIRQRFRAQAKDEE